MGPCRLNDKNDDILSREVRVKSGVIQYTYNWRQIFAFNLESEISQIYTMNPDALREDTDSTNWNVSRTHR